VSGPDPTPCRHGFGRGTCAVCCSKTDAEIDAELASSLDRKAGGVAEALSDGADDWPFDDDPPDPL
jgi:hypothetical protein